MRVSVLTSFLTLLAAAAGKTTTSTTTTTVKLHVPASHALPNPRSLPPSTHATLVSLGLGPAPAYLTPSNAFVFRNVSEGSYLLDVHCATHAFAPLRVDVLPLSAGDVGSGKAEEEQGPAGLRVRAWETFRGNDWDNKGEALGASGRLEVRVLGPKAFFMERSSCEFLRLATTCEENCANETRNANTVLPVNVMSILKNPMILLGLVSMGIFVGMPYLVDNSKFSLLVVVFCRTDVP